MRIQQSANVRVARHVHRRFTPIVFQVLPSAEVEQDFHSGSMALHGCFVKCGIPMFSGSVDVRSTFEQRKYLVNVATTCRHVERTLAKQSSLIYVGQVDAAESWQIFVLVTTQYLFCFQSVSLN
jgi:hypothetical protein